MFRTLFGNDSADFPLASPTATTISTESVAGLPTEGDIFVDPDALNPTSEGIEGTLSHETEALMNLSGDLTFETTDFLDATNDLATEIAFQVPELLATVDGTLEEVIAGIDANVFAAIEAGSEATFEGVSDAVDTVLDATVDTALGLDSTLTLVVEDAGIAGQTVIEGAGEIIADVDLTLDTLGDGVIDSLSDTAAEVRDIIDTGLDAAVDSAELALEVADDAVTTVGVIMDDASDAVLDLQATLNESALIGTTKEVAGDLLASAQTVIEGAVTDLSILDEDEGLLADVVAEVGEISFALLGDNMTGDDDLSILLDIQSDDDDLMEDVIEDEAIVELGLF